MLLALTRHLILSIDLIKQTVESSGLHKYLSPMIIWTLFLISVYQSDFLRAAQIIILEIKMWVSGEAISRLPVKWLAHQ